MDDYISMLDTVMDTISSVFDLIYNFITGLVDFVVNFPTYLSTAISGADGFVKISQAMWGAMPEQIWIPIILTLSTGLILRIMFDKSRD